uniref:Uncharacterized protein n=1 Tax=Brassica oleracea TaxID=3712 RepID=A0A3P6G6Y6_BRAOL|nr:unnamed protein product [Brassica oleracea]
MLDKMIKGQEKELMSSFSQMLGIVYTEPNEKSETMNAQIEKPDIEVQWTDEFARREEADISDTTSTSTDGTTSTSTNSRTSTSTYGTTSMSTDGTTSTSIDSTTSTSTNDMDQNSKKKLDDDQNTSRGDLETSPKASIGRHQPDEFDRHPPCIIDQHPPSIIVRHLPDNIILHPPESMNRHPLLDEPHDFIVEMEPIEERVHESEASHNTDSKHLRPLICTEEDPGLHKRAKRIHDPISSYIKVLDDHQHVEASQRGLRFRDEVDKGPAEAVSIDTDRIPSNDTNKPASIDITISLSIDTGRKSEQKEFDVRGNLRDGDTTTRSDKSGIKKRRNWKKRKMIKDGLQGRKRSKEELILPAAIDNNMPLSVDRASRVSIDRHLTVSIDAHHWRAGGIRTGFGGYNHKGLLHKDSNKKNLNGIWWRQSSRFDSHEFLDIGQKEVNMTWWQPTLRPDSWKPVQSWSMILPWKQTLTKERN